MYYWLLGNRPWSTNNKHRQIWSFHSTEICLCDPPCRHTVGGGLWVYSFLTLALDWGGWSTPYPRRLIQGKRPASSYTESWMGPKASLEVCGEEEISCLLTAVLKNIPLFQSIMSYWLVHRYHRLERFCCLCLHVDSLGVRWRQKQHAHLKLW